MRILKAKKAAVEERPMEHKAATVEEDLDQLETFFNDVLEAKNPVKLT